MLLEDALPAYLKSGSGDGGVLPLTGLVSRSAQEGHWLIYPSLDMGRRLEIAEADILDFEPLSAEQSPFGRLGGTRVLVRKNAVIATTRVSARAGQAAEDEFDLDIRLGAGKSTPKDTCEGSEDGTTCGLKCETDGCDTNGCETDGCQTDGCETVGCTAGCLTAGCAPTHANTCKATCAPTCLNTCAPTCKATCANTCAATCHTCETKCQTPTCPPHCKPETAACTHVTCGNQPACRR
jgi:hypothetical protein